MRLALGGASGLVSFNWLSARVVSSDLKHITMKICSQIKMCTVVSFVMTFLLTGQSLSVVVSYFSGQRMCEPCSCFTSQHAQTIESIILIPTF